VFQREMRRNQSVKTNLRHIRDLTRRRPAAGINRSLTIVAHHRRH